MHLPGPVESLALRVGVAVAHLVAGARRRDMSVLWQEVQKTRAEGVVLLARIKGAEDTERARRWLARAVFDWCGPFEETLARLAPELFEEFRSPGIPAGVAYFDGERELWRDEAPFTLTVLRDVVRADLRRLRRIHRRLVWGIRPLRRPKHDQTHPRLPPRV